MMAVENRILRHDLETIDSEAENRTNGAEYFTMKWKNIFWLPERETSMLIKTICSFYTKSMIRDLLLGASQQNLKASRMRRYAEQLDWLYTSPL